MSSKSDDRNPKCTTSSMTVQKTSLTNRSEIFDKEIDKDVRIPAGTSMFRSLIQKLLLF